MMLSKLRLLTFLISMFSGAQASGQTFNDLLEGLQEIPHHHKDSVIIQYLETNRGTPLLEGDTVIFLTKSLYNQPKIISGFNGFLNPRYITDTTAGNMLSIESTNWYYLKKSLRPDARIFYQIKDGPAVLNDPLNSQLGFRFDLINSEFRMPEFEMAEELINHQFVPPGKVLFSSYASEIMQHQRTISIYLPAGYDQHDQKYPVVYFHDGSAYIQMGQVPKILDYLIANKKIPPLIGVFDDPVVRGKEYRGDQDYINYMNQELIPFVDSNYQTLAYPENRAVVGGSRGGRSSLILSHSIDKFSKCGVFSPAIHPREMDEFISFLSNADYRPEEVAMVGALYDGIWLKDSKSLKEYFEASETKFTYREIPQGHHIQGWVSELDEILAALFPFNNEP